MSFKSAANGRKFTRNFALVFLMSVASLASAAVNNNPSIGLAGALSGANTLLLGVTTGEQYKATLSWPSDASGHHPRTGRYKFEVDTPAGGAGGLPAGLTLEISRDGTAYAAFPQTYALGTDDCLVYVRATVPAGTIVSTAHNGSFHLKVSWECDNGAFFNMPNASKLVLLKGGRIVLKWQDHGMDNLVLTNGELSDEIVSEHQPNDAYFINQSITSAGTWFLTGSNTGDEWRVGINDDFGLAGDVTNEGANEVNVQEDYYSGNSYLDTFQFQSKKEIQSVERVGAETYPSTDWVTVQTYAPPALTPRTIKLLITNNVASTHINEVELVDSTELTLNITSTSTIGGSAKYGPWKFDTNLTSTVASEVKSKAMELTSYRLETEVVVTGTVSQEFVQNPASAGGVPVKIVKRLNSKRQNLKAVVYVDQDPRDGFPEGGEQTFPAVAHEATNMEYDIVPIVTP